ncbi:MAG: trypsin-like peptidase domain-containing protein [Planctomycetota bacterium]
MRVQLLHLDGPDKGRTITYEGERLIVGTSETADVRYTEGLTVLGRHAEIFLGGAGRAFHMRALEGEVFVNHREVEEVILEPNDLIEIGRHGPKMRFRIHAGKGRAQKAVSQIIRDAREVGQASGVYALTQSMFDDIRKRSSTRMRVGLPVAILLVATAAAYLGGVLGGRGSSDDEEVRAAQVRELERLQARLEGNRKVYEREISRIQRDLADVREGSQGDLDALRAEIERHRGIVDNVIKRDSALKQVLNTYSRGVCLLHGIFQLNFRRGDKLVPLRGGDGKPLRIEYVGSGFLAAKDGHVITNRHVAHPWWGNARVEPLVKRGLVPEFVLFDAIFPGRDPLPVEIESIRVSDEVDVAVVRVPNLNDVPILPLHRGPVGKYRGERIVLLGYPTGASGLLARAERKTVTEVLNESNDLTTLIDELAERGAIAPAITQGALNEVKPSKLVYDADTTSGGSGGPVFGPDGTVVGVNYAVMKDFKGSNFGVPIRFALALLP